MLGGAALHQLFVDLAVLFIELRYVANRSFNQRGSNGERTRGVS
jgi:hypothetical protein